MHSCALANSKGYFTTVFELVYACCLKAALSKEGLQCSAGFFKRTDLPLWTAPVYVYPRSIHFGTFQPELIGDYFPLHSLYLSPALYRLTEVVLILLTLPTNRVRRRCNVVQCYHNKGCLFLLCICYSALSRCHFFYCMD